MALTPDAIERRTFPIADWGYDRGEVHKFLVEMAAVLRAAEHRADDEAAPTRAADVDGDAVHALRADALELVDEDGRADSGRLSERISQILEAAETLASGIHADAEQALLVARSNAEQEVADRRREAEADADVLREQAKRLLVSSQEQAGRIIAEAEEQAESVRAAADSRAKVRNQRLQRVAEQHAERVLRFERDAIARLHAAQDDLQQAIERLTGSEHSPVLDLSGGQPAVRVGSIEVDGPRPVPAVRRRITERSTERTSDQPNADPVNRLVRAAVERAVEHAGKVEPAPPPPPPPPPGAEGDHAPVAGNPSPADSSV